MPVDRRVVRRTSRRAASTRQEPSLGEALAARSRGARLLHDRRGGSLVEYLIIVGFVVIALLTAWRGFGTSARGAAIREAALVASLESGANSGGGCLGGLCLNGNCFVAGTLVATPAGLRPIERLAVGDDVFSRDEATGTLRVRRVARTFATTNQAIVDVRLQGGDRFQATPGHLFWTVDRGWTEAVRLRAGEPLVAAGGAPLRVSSVVPLADAATVYNLEVEGTHTYFVGRDEAWVHNAGPCGGSGSENGGQSIANDGPAQNETTPGGAASSPAASAAASGAGAAGGGAASVATTAAAIGSGAGGVSASSGGSAAASASGANGVGASPAASAASVASTGTATGASSGATSFRLPDGTVLTGALADQAIALHRAVAAEVPHLDPKYVVVAGIMDTKSGQIFINKNYSPAEGNVVPYPLHPLLIPAVGRLNDDPQHFSTPGAHAEIRALNEALYAREAATGRPVTSADLPTFMVDTRWLRGSNPGGMNRGDQALLCGNCQATMPGIINLAGNAGPRPSGASGGPH